MSEVVYVTTNKYAKYAKGIKFCCKKDEYIETEIANIFFEGGKQYEVTHVFNDNTIGINSVVFETEYCKRGKYSNIYLYDYFYNKTELRENKLNRILKNK